MSVLHEAGHERWGFFDDKLAQQLCSSVEGAKSRRVQRVDVGKNRMHVVQGMHPQYVVQWEPSCRSWKVCWRDFLHKYSIHLGSDSHNGRLCGRCSRKHGRCFWNKWCCCGGRCISTGSCADRRRGAELRRRWQLGGRRNSECIWRNGSVGQRWRRMREMCVGRFVSSSCKFNGGHRVRNLQDAYLHFRVT